MKTCKAKNPFLREFLLLKNGFLHYNNPFISAIKALKNNTLKTPNLPFNPREISQGEQLSRPPAINEVAEKGEINIAKAQPTIIVRANPMSVRPILAGTIVATRAVPITTGCSPNKEGTIIKSIIEPIKSTGY